MKNTLVIEPTLFINHRSSSLTCGWRAHDDNSQTYANTWHDGIPSDDMEFLKKVLKSDDDTLWDMLALCGHENRGLFIADKYYPWNEIEHLVDTESKAS